MTFVQRLLPLALLSFASYDSHAAGNGSIEPYSATVAPAGIAAMVAAQTAWSALRPADGRPAAAFSVDYRLPSGWSAGTWTYGSGARAADDGWPGWSVHVGYGGTAYDPMVPGARVGGDGRRDDHGEVAAGLRYRSLYAGYHRSFARDAFGIAGARGAGYFDAGVKHELGGAMTLNLHAGGGRVGGAGNGGIDWRDLKAGLSRRLEGGWALSGTYGRAFGAGNGAAADRYAGAMPRTDLRLPAGTKSRSGALVMTLSRRF